MKDKTGHKDFGIKLKDLVENKRKDLPPEDREDILEEIIQAWDEARSYTDEYLYTDHIGWLKESFNKGWFEFPDDYDFDTNRWTIGFSLAQIERYGGIVMDTKKGTLPLTNIPTNLPDKKAKKKKTPITES